MATAAPLPGRLTVALDTNVLLDLLVARNPPATPVSSPQLARGKATERAITATTDRVVVVQHVFYEALDKLLERNRLLTQLNAGYVLGPRWADWPAADQNSHLAGWNGADGAAARMLLEGIQTDPDLQVELFPTSGLTDDWFVSQRVFYEAHQRQGPWFHLSDLIIVCQVIVARADRLVTRDGGIRKGVERLRADASFLAALRGIASDLAVPALSKTF